MAQRDAAWVRTATPEDVVAAHAAGELTDLIASRSTEAAEPVETTPREGQKSMAWLKTATPEQVDAAHNAGELDRLLGRDGIPTESDKTGQI